MHVGPSHRWLLVALALALPLMMTAACTGSEGVPDSQQLRPTAAPSGWQPTDLGMLSIAAPPDWTKAGTTEPEDGTKITTWRTTPVDGKSTAGMEVREISVPDNKAALAVKALAVNAMATMQGGKPDPAEITWPNAAEAWMLHNDVTFGPTPDQRETYDSATLVADREDGTQVQVILFVKKGTDDDLALRVLSTVKLVKVKA